MTRGKFRRPREQGRRWLAGQQAVTTRRHKCQCGAWIVEYDAASGRAVQVRDGAPVKGTSGRGPPPGRTTFVVHCVKCGAPTEWTEPTRPMQPLHQPGAVL